MKWWNVFLVYLFIYWLLRVFQYRKPVRYPNFQLLPDLSSCRSGESRSSALVPVHGRSSGRKRNRSDRKASHEWKNSENVAGQSRHSAGGTSRWSSYRRDLFLLHPRYSKRASSYWRMITGSHIIFFKSLLGLIMVFRCFLDFKFASGNLVSLFFHDDLFFLHFFNDIKFFNVNVFDFCYFNTDINILVINSKH